MVDIPLLDIKKNVRPYNIKKSNATLWNFNTDAPVVNFILLKNKKNVLKLVLVIFVIMFGPKQIKKEEDFLQEKREKETKTSYLFFF